MLIADRAATVLGGSKFSCAATCVSFVEVVMLIVDRAATVLGGSKLSCTATCESFARQGWISLGAVFMCTAERTATAGLMGVKFSSI